LTLHGKRGIIEPDRKHRGAGTFHANSRSLLRRNRRTRAAPADAVASAPGRGTSPLNGAFTAAAIPRLDGSDGDGVHLLWTPPHTAGYSVDGWDIQRRKSHGNGLMPSVPGGTF
jgi:hypothetical protein